MPEKQCLNCHYWLDQGRSSDGGKPLGTCRRLLENLGVGINSDNDRLPCGECFADEIWTPPDFFCKFWIGNE